MTARGVRRSNGGMNKLETAYASHLEARRISGEVEWFMFEGVKLRLADATFYTPDFFVMLANGELEAHETKGFWEDDARVKIKVAASLYPLRFIAVTRESKDAPWRFELFGRRGEPAKKNCLEKPLSSGVQRGGPACNEQGVPSQHNATPGPIPKRKATKGVTEADLQAWRPGQPVPPGYALFGGKLVTTEFALDLIKKGA